MTISLPIAPEANQLLTNDPLALLIGMVLDQQIPLEKAFTSPLVLQERLGRPLDAADIAALDPEQLGSIFATPPALHRFPGSMAGRVQSLCQAIVDEYGGDPAAIWSSAPDGPTLLKRVKKLPGFGEAKARIFVALLGKQLAVTPSGWRDAAGPYGVDGSLLSVADIRDKGTLDSVRAYKKQAKAAAKGGKAAEA
jgi:uncharacterized HhH-GPD family protein